MDLDTSVTRLQEQVEVLQRERLEDRESAREIRTDVKTTREVVQRLEISIAALSNQPRCAAPSTCLVLQPKVSEHDQRIRSVENIIEQGKGGWRAISLISALGGGSIGALISWLLHGGKP